MDNIEEKGRKVAIDIVKANVFAVVIMVVSAILWLRRLDRYTGTDVRGHRRA